jgi:Ricin-type beta-trefoil lectin domain
MPTSRFLRRAAALVAAVTAVVVFTGPVPASADQLGRLVNAGTDLCADMPANRQVGSPLVNNPCDGSLTQDWTLVTTNPAFWKGRFYYHLVNFIAGGCIGVANASRSERAAVVILNCANVQEEYWTPVAVRQFTIWANLLSGKCMRPKDGDAQDGTAMEQIDCDGTNIYWFQF